MLGVATDGRTFLGDLADQVAAVRPDDITASALKNARRAIIDLLGVAVAGSDHEVVKRCVAYAAAAGSSGDCSIIGHGTAGPETAAHVNAVAGHILDFDDSSSVLGGHPSVTLLPALLALAEDRHASGIDVMTCYVAGYEALERIAAVMNFRHYELGWHPTATLGVLGAAAGCAKLLGLDGTGIHASMAVAASFSAGLKANFGTDMKAVQVGHAARDAVAAALLGEAGVVGNPSIFEAPTGFRRVYNALQGGSGECPPIESRAPSEWELANPGPAIKLYPCCASTHPAIEAAREIRRRTRDLHGIDSIVARLHPRRLAHTDSPSPSTPLEAKFSLQYVVASALVHGNVTLAHFEPEALVDRRVRQVMSLVKVEPLPPERRGTDHFAGEVTLRRRGTAIDERVERAKGRGSDRAVTDDELASKFLDCTTPVLGRRAEGLLERLMRFDNVQDAASLAPLLVGTKPMVNEKVGQT